MSRFLEKYEFEKPPKEINYFDEEPLKLNQQFQFFHNKNRFRKNINEVQYLFKEYVNFALHAAGIRDTYLSEKNTENNLIIIFTTPDVIHKANEIFESHNKVVEKGCFYIRSTSEYIFLKAVNMKGMKAGLERLYDLLKQTLDDYFTQKKFDDYIKIRPFEIYNCI
jgi:hypothetical protein